MSPSAGAPASADGAVKRLRDELAATQDKGRQARLLAEIADAEESAGDEAAAARDYLAAYTADATYREPLEGLIRLLEKRRSFKNLGRLVDALARVAVTPDEKVRALLMRSAYLADVSADTAEAKVCAREATEVEGAATAEQAIAWLSLEVLAGRTADPAAREEALAHRSAFASQAHWRALLLVDRARLAAGGGDVEGALGLLREASGNASEATWTATTELERVAQDASLTADAPPERADVHAGALEALASMIQDALWDPARGDSHGVPHWARDPAHLVDLWLRAAEARVRCGQIERAAETLDRALAYAAGLQGEAAALANAALAQARMRVAEQAGDGGLAARLAAQRLAVEKDGRFAAALALRVAEHAASQGDARAALEALGRAIESDPGCLPARALQLDMLADGADPAAFAAQLEAFAEHLATDEARGRAFLLAAYVWATRANDAAGAKAALSQAAMYGVGPTVTGRLARALASIAGDAAWYEEATKRLLAAGAEGDAVALYVELIRSRAARGDGDGVARAIAEMAALPRGRWLARAFEAFAAPTASGADPAHARAQGERALAALEELASLEGDAELARGLALVAAMRALALGDAERARKHLRDLAERDASDSVVITFLGDLERAAGDHAAAARVAADAATATQDPELSAALHLEAGFERWRAGNRRGAVQELEAAAATAPDASHLALAWAARGVDVDTVEGRRLAIERALAAAPGDAQPLALERFATEVGGGDPDDALAALAALDAGPEGDLAVAAALARTVWSAGAADAAAVKAALARLAARGPRALLLAASEQFRLAREDQDVQESARAAASWFEAGGGLPAALEWLGAAMQLGQPADEKGARLAVAGALGGEARESMFAGAALLEARIHPYEPAPLVASAAPAARLANLELSPPGADPRRRAIALTELGDALGADAGTDATLLAGWSSFAATDFKGAAAAFERAAVAHPEDLAAWEGLRAAAEQSGDRPTRARAAEELGARCHDAGRGAAFWEEAALLHLDLGGGERAERALDAGFARDATRGVTFDKLFRRVRERKDNDKLLALVARRLDVTDEPQEIQKLFWEQARVLREKGDHAGALAALEHVTMLDPDHVGALALLGEINIKRANFEEAAEALGRLAQLDAAPGKNRLTAGIAAVDLYENKLNRFDRALEILLTLHHANLSSLPVRERLARAAARTGSWVEATAILETLMHERSSAEGRVEAARLAMAIYRDRLSKPQEAARAIVKLLEESPTDGEALDMLLSTEHVREVRERLLRSAREELVVALRTRPTDLAFVRRLAKVTRALGDEALQQAALGVQLALGAGDAQTEGAFAQLSARKARTPQIAISDSTLRSILARGDEGPLADLFVLLGPTLAEALGPSLQASGVGRRDKVDPRSGLALRNEIASWAGAFGIKEFDLYVGGKDPLAVQGVPGEPPSLIVGSGVTAPLAPLTRARIARELLAITRGTTVTRARDDITVAAVVVAACGLAELRVDHPPYAVLAEVERLLGKAIARRTRKALPEICQAIVKSGADARAWSRRALASHDRVAVVASGDPSAVLLDVLGTTPEKLGQAIKGNARAEELLRFVLSPPYLEIRRALGLEGSA